jgi:mannose-1-phosphate guanylyltransferase
MDSRKFADTTGHLWVVVLAADDDRSSRSTTASPAELFVPTQFRRQHDTGITPLQAALRRATALVPRQRICALVGEEHKQWWRYPLWFLSASNVFSQPRKLAPAYGLAAALLRIHARDPAARVVLLPSTHKVRDENVLAQSLRDAAQRVMERQSLILLLGVEPEGGTTQRAAIVTGPRRGINEFELDRLIDAPFAERGYEQRLLWNTGTVTGGVQSLLAAFQRRWPEVFDEMRTVVRRNPRDRAIHPVAGGFDGRSSDPTVAQLLLSAKQALRVLRVPLCGWSDLSSAALKRNTRYLPRFGRAPPLLTGPVAPSRQLLPHQADGG